jgi:hypothetical protein
LSPHGLPQLMPANRLPLSQPLEVPVQLEGRPVTLLGIVRAGADNDLLELEQPLVVGVRTQVGRQLRELLAVFAEDSLVKGFPQTVDVALGRAGPFRRDVPPLPTNDWASDKAIARTLKRCGIGTVGNYCQS